jgi:hypothetical protein
MALGIGHQEVREPFADRRDENVGIAGPQARDEFVIGCLEIGQQLARLRQIELEPFVERRG